jgi:hypothetical protein
VVRGHSIGDQPLAIAGGPVGIVLLICHHAVSIPLPLRGQEYQYFKDS